MGAAEHRSSGGSGTECSVKRWASTIAVSLVAFVALLALVPASPTAAQEVDPAATSTAATDVPAGPSWPTAEAIAGAILGGLGDIIEQALVAFFEHSGAAISGRLLTAAFGVLADFLWRALGPLFGGVNIFTQLPAAWSYDLRPVGELRGRLVPIARSIVLLGLVMGIGWAVAGTLLGRPFGRILNVAPTFLLASAGLLVTPQLARWWIDLCNALSGALLDPATGLPGLSTVQGWERLSALGAVAVVYLVACFLLLLHRLKLVVIVVLLLTVAPLAVAAGALPIPQAQRLFHWWLTTFLAATFVQVLQAACLGIGAWLLSSPFRPGALEGPADGMLAASVGIGAVMAAMSLPQMLLGSLARANLAPGVLSTVLHSAAMLAGIGIAWRTAGAAAGVARFSWTALPSPGFGGDATDVGTAQPQQRPRTGSGFVRSLLAGAPSGVPLLPPPAP